MITGYTARVDHAKLGRPLEAFTELRFAGTTQVDDIAGVADGHARGPGGLHDGRRSRRARLDPRAATSTDLKRVVDQLRRSGRVTGTKTLMVLGTSERARASL